MVGLHRPTRIRSAG